MKKSIFMIIAYSLVSFYELPVNADCGEQGHRQCSECQQRNVQLREQYRVCSDSCEHQKESHRQRCIEIIHTTAAQCMMDCRSRIDTCDESESIYCDRSCNCQEDTSVCYQNDSNECGCVFHENSCTSECTCDRSSNSGSSIRAD